MNLLLQFCFILILLYNRRRTVPRGLMGVNGVGYLVRHWNTNELIIHCFLFRSEEMCGSRCEGENSDLRCVD